MKRSIITIDEDLCNGCGDCVPNCPEGALQIVDGKASLVGELLCDGLGACIGRCPLGAITVEERDAEPYDERKVLDNVIPEGREVLKAHLNHLLEHGQTGYYATAQEYLKEKGIPIPEGVIQAPAAAQQHTPRPVYSGCPGARAFTFQEEKTAPGQPGGSTGPLPSALSHWPIQLHLINPAAPHYRGSDFLLAADCTAFSLGGFHGEYLRGKSLAIACPKLDDGREVYVEKLTGLIDHGQVNTISIMIMEVPCCGGLTAIMDEARNKAARKVPLKLIQVGLQGDILKEEWI